ncbi:MAG: hypothetical protein ACOVSR_08395 [Bacteroidia bacterium]
MKNIKYLFFVLTIITVFACKKGYEGNFNNSPNPETFMAVSKIERSGTNRLTTRVDAYWWGTSANGFVVGYEVSIDSMKTWTYTNRSDSTLLLTIPIGSDTANIDVYVRAIDNIGQKDLTPASLAYPVRNSAPSVSLYNIAGKKTTKSFPAVHFFWTSSDADGLQDINGFDIFLNDTNSNPYSIQGNVLDVTIMADNLFSDSCFVFPGTKNKALEGRIKGIKYNDWNYFYIKAFDKAGLRSAFVYDSIFIKKPVSKTLFVNAYLTSRNTPQKFINDRINTFVPLFDTLYLNNRDAQQNNFEQSPDALTQSRVFSFFNKIIWVSDEGATAASLSLAQQSTVDFFENGGQMFMMCNFGSDIPNELESFGFTPIQKLVTDSSGLAIRMNINDEITPFDNTWPTLKCNTIISSARPFYTQTASSGTSNFDSLYNAKLITLGPGGVRPFNGQSTVVAKRISLKYNKTAMVFMSLPIQNLNGNNNASIFLEKVFKNELGF